MNNMAQNHPRLAAMLTGFVEGTANGAPVDSIDNTIATALGVTAVRSWRPPYTPARASAAGFRSVRDTSGMLRFLGAQRHASSYAVLGPTEGPHPVRRLANSWALSGPIASQSAETVTQAAARRRRALTRKSRAEARAGRCRGRRQLRTASRPAPSRSCCPMESTGARSPCPRRSR